MVTQTLHSPQHIPALPLKSRAMRLIELEQGRTPEEMFQHLSLRAISRLTDVHPATLCRWRQHLTPPTPTVIAAAPGTVGAPTHYED